MAYKIYSKDNIVILDYEPINGVDWIIKEFTSENTIKVVGTFVFSHEMLLEKIELDSKNAIFKIGEVKDGYYVINKDILQTKYNVFISQDIKLTNELFVIYYNISIFRKIDKLIRHTIILESKESENINKQNVITIKMFNEILKKFPSSTEIKHYKDSRITNILKQYLDNVVDSEIKLEKIQNKKNKTNYNGDKQNQSIIEDIKVNELNKYIAIYDIMRNMLNDLNSYSEKQWQIEIIKILKFIFPKYICIIPELIIYDYYTTSNKTNRMVDFALISSDGYIDIIEIKKPMTNSLITKNEYRGNFIPVKELSGSIMQVEKYIFHLNKWGKQGEIKLNESYQNILKKVKIKIANPKGIILIGIEGNLNKKQMFDFEIIKRKYSNIMDIITYDELIRRIENQIKTIKPDYDLEKIELPK